MVEGHLNKQRSAYDHWIAELCRDAEESAMERDRLKAKLAALRDDHKRKVMTKIIGRLGNMNYFVAWNHWHTVTITGASGILPQICLVLLLAVLQVLQICRLLDLHILLV